MTFDRSSVGFVLIGRNEGERLKRCLRSVIDQAGAVVYVDSGSNDGSVEHAESVGASVVQLDMARPFTAARARNEGIARLREIDSDLLFVHVVDGDCEVHPDWLQSALDDAARDEHIAVICGRRRERSPGASRYNRLCDMEWDTPIGDAQSCGGDALIRLEAFDDIDGYDESLIAGEEPEMCFRMRRRGWRIRRIDHEMTLHDANITRFSQWWKRALRAGHAYAEGMALHGKTEERYRVRQVMSALAWALALPLVAIVLAPFTLGLSPLLLAAYALLWLRVYGHRLKHGDSTEDANLYAGFCILGKFAHAAGIMKYWFNRLRGKRSRIIEYKQTARSAELKRGMERAS